jgi:hypothetical protein
VMRMVRQLAPQVGEHFEVPPARGGIAAAAAPANGETLGRPLTSVQPVEPPGLPGTDGTRHELCVQTRD